MAEKATFLKAVFDLKELPKDEKPEVILCGRSNVGKSSFINTFLNVPGMAKTSSTPGKTRSINYFLLPTDIYLVDMPGYGYSKASQSEITKYSHLTENFLRQRNEDRLIFSLVDSRHEPSKLDVGLWQFLVEERLNFAIILTKCDKVKRNRISEAVREVRAILPELTLQEGIYPYSAVSLEGKKAIASRIQNFTQFCKS